MIEKIKGYITVLRKGTKSDFYIIAGITLLFLAIIITNVHLVLNMITNQTEEIGQMELENIRSSLQEDLTDAENTTLRISLEAEQMIKAGTSRANLAPYFERQSRIQHSDFKEACIDVYIAGRDWAIIPGFNIPANYHPPERIWYKGAVNNPGKVYITDPYLDARTGEMCYTTSIALSDGQTVVAMDFNFINTQKLIQEMIDGEGRFALIATANGKIISCNDMSLIGENVSKKLPEYEGILSRVVNETEHKNFSVTLSDGDHTIFSNHTNNGWYLILSIDETILYKDSHRQMIGSTLFSLFMLIIIVMFYLSGIKNKLEAEEAVRAKEEFLSNLSHDLREPLNKIISLSHETDESKKANSSIQIRESAQQLSGMLDDLFTFSSLISKEKEKVYQPEELIKMSKSNKNLRKGIVAILIAAMICSLGIYISTVIELANLKMNRAVDTYQYQLSNWLAREKSILSMFTNYISERPEIMNNYPAAVKWLNDIAKHYPEISACYMANPYKNPTVIMNTGWQGPPGWHVEERRWYIDTEKSSSGFNISTPYYDDQTGLYCVTLSQIIYGKRGEFLGIFAIDFYLDSLIKILSDSYNKHRYAFLIDKNGNIINHPNINYQMSATHMTNVKETKYLDSYMEGDLSRFNDYNDTLSVCLAKKNDTSDFTVVVVNSCLSIYGDIFSLSAFLFLLFVLCIILIDLLIDRLFEWQDSVNDQLKKAINAAVSAGKAKSQFFAQMSHEIRTPINAVIGMNEMILRESRDPAVINYSQNAAAAGESLLSLINDILDFSKLESDKMELVEENYHLDDLIKNLINMIKFRAEKKNLDFKVKVNEDVPNELFGDSVRIRQVVVNFLTNAVKYTKVGGVVFSVDMDLGIDDENGESAGRQMGEILLKFSVKDSGIGIRDEDKSKLFKDFERFDAKQNKNIEGTGLGLAITAKLVKMMRGKIEVESVYGEGSTFTVLVPQKVINRKGVGKFVEKIEKEKPKSESYRVSFVAPDARILVVDDNEMNLLVATSLLKVTQIQVDTAMSGTSALKKMADTKYDVIFLDQMMPELDGIQTLKLAKEMDENKSKDAPMIALTANAISGAREMFLKEGFNDYLSKPIDAAALEKMLMEYLPKNKLQEPPEVSEEVTVRSTARPTQPPPTTKEAPAPQNPSALLNVGLGLQYSAGMEDMYRNVLQMFCNLKDEKKAKIQEAYDTKNWNDYTTFVHALKSTSLSIGSEKTSELAKKLEESGKILTANSSSESDKQQSEAFINNHHAEAMELYDKLVEEGRNYLNDGSNTMPAASVDSTDVNVKAETVNEEPSAEEGDDDSDLEIMLGLQDAFENEDWIKYTEMIERIKEDSDNDAAGKFKQLHMACKMVTSDLTSDDEKAEAIQYIKDNHAKVLEAL